MLNSDQQIQKKILILSNIFDNYENISKIPKKGELIFKCVNKKCGSHLKRKDKFCINIFKESAHCWVCGVKYGNISNLIKKIGSQKDFSDWISVQEKNEYLIDEKDDKKDEVIYYNSYLNKMVSVFNLQHDHPARIYLRTRNTPLDKSIMFNIHYAESLIIDDKKIFNCLCIPSHSYDGINYLFFRSIKNSFKYNCKSQKTNIIFNDLFINWNKPICLTEGIFDSIRIFPYIQSIPILGSYLDENSLLFKKIIQKKPPKVFVCLDPEIDAIKKQIKILDLLSYWGINAFSIILMNFDLGDSTDKEIIDAVNNAKHYTNTYKLETLINL